MNKRCYSYSPPLFADRISEDDEELARDFAPGAITETRESTRNALNDNVCDISEEENISTDNTVVIIDSIDTLSSDESDSDNWMVTKPTTLFRSLKRESVIIISHTTL